MHSPRPAWQSSSFTPHRFQRCCNCGRTWCHSLTNKQGKAQAVDVRGAIVALDTYYAEMQATGANDRIQRAILDGQDAYINYGLSQDQAELAYSLATKSGIIVDRNQFEGTLQSTSAQRREQIAYLKRVGMRGIEQRFLGLLRSLESQMESGALSQGRSSTLAGLLVGGAGAGFGMDAWDGGGRLRVKLVRVSVDAEYLPSCASWAGAFGLLAILTADPIAAGASVLYGWASAQGYC